MRPVIGSILIGAAGGVLAGFVVWLIARRQLEQKLAAGAGQLTEQFGAGRVELDRALAAGRVELDREVRARVRAEVPGAVDQGIQQALQSYGLTPETGLRLRRVLERVESIGLVGVRR